MIVDKNIILDVDKYIKEHFHTINIPLENKEEKEEFSNILIMSLKSVDGNLIILKEK